MAASLLEMVAHLSMGRKNNPQIDKKFNHILSQLSLLKLRLFQLAEEDANGYQKVMEAFKLPKNNETEKELRRQAIEKAFEGAIATPLALLEETISLADWNAFTLKNGNINAFSDAGVAYHLIRTAFEGGKMNVLINLDSLHNDDSRRAFQNRLENIEKRFNTKKKLIENQIKIWIEAILE